jgi:hypothetical protein
VLPSLIPQVNPYAGASQLCANAPFGSSFSYVNMGFPPVTTCPNGFDALANTCLWPRRFDAPADQGFNCINGAGNLPAGTPAASTDACTT